jgi:transaldolase
MHVSRFNVAGSMEKARRLIKLYQEQELIGRECSSKLPSTWKELMPPMALQKEGINCNLTLMFSLPQAVRCAEAGVELISPFVGRIYIGTKPRTNELHGAGRPRCPIGPGDLHLLQEVRIQDRSDGCEFPECWPNFELAGSDLLTISPELMEQLSNSFEPVERKLTTEKAKSENVERLELDEKKFRYLVNDNAMATEKTAEGIRKFAADIVKLEKFIAAKLKQ